MALKELVFNLPLRLRLHCVVGVKYYSSKETQIIESAEEEPIYEEEASDYSALEQKRNKSRLNPQHRNILFGRKPFEESMAFYHDTVSYKKRMLGRYGLEALGIPAGMAWPTPKEVEEMKEYENVAYPLSLEDRWQKIKDEKKKEEERVMARQNEVVASMANMKQLIATVQAKIAKKQQAEEEAKLRKEQKIEKIRQQLIQQGSMSKQSLEQALAMAAKDEKKKKKEAKKLRTLEREQRYITQMSKKLNTETAETEDNEDTAENKE